MKQIPCKTSTDSYAEEFHWPVLPVVPAIDRSKLTLAVKAALSISNPQCHSLAWAVSTICSETAKPGEAEEIWIPQFFLMEAGAYSVKWNTETNSWSHDGHIGFGGLYLAYLCADRIDRKLSLNAQGEGNSPLYPEKYDDVYGAWRHEVGAEIPRFLMPDSKEVVRRTWIVERGEQVFLHNLDIRPAAVSGLYEYIVTERGNPIALARSRQPMDAHSLELTVRAGILPPTACAPFDRGESLWPEHPVYGTIKS